MQKLENEHLWKFLNNRNSLENINQLGQLILVGKIVSTYGVQGAVKIISSFELLPLSNCLGEFIITLPDDFLRSIRVNVIWVKPYKHYFRVLFKGICNKMEAKLLVGSSIYVKKSELPPLEEDTYLWSDLIGIIVQTVTGEILGHIDSIIYTGSNDVYVVTPKISTSNEILIPAIKSVILNIDLSARLMVVDLPDGIRDINE